jgi:hypothetical protein
MMGADYRVVFHPAVVPESDRAHFSIDGRRRPSPCRN